MNPFARFKNYIIGDALAATEDVFQKARIDLLFNITVFFLLLGLTYYVNLIANHYVWLTCITTIGVISLPTVLIILKKTGNVRLAGIFFLAEQVVIGFLNEIMTNFHFDGEGAFWAAFMLLFSFFVLGTTWGWIMTLYSVVTITIGITNEQSHFSFFHFNIPKEQLPPQLLYIVFFPMAICVYSIYRMVATRNAAEKQINLQKNLLQKSNKEMASKNEDIISSINYAKKIQYAVLPNEETIYRSIPLSFIIYQPRDIVSGDFFWFHESWELGVGSSELETRSEGKNPDNNSQNSELKTNSELRTQNSELIYIVAADCTGHGVPGAFMTVIGSNALTQTIIENKITKPSEILLELDNRVTSTLKQEKTHHGLIQDGMDLALLKINKAKKEFIFTSAKRPAFFIRNGEMQEIKGSKFSIGGLRSETKVFNEIVINYQEDDMIYLFSDGYVDQFGGAHDKKLTTKRLREALHAIYQLPISEQKKRLTEIFDSWKGKNEQTDDMLVIGIRF
jgi:serine phosphatase RsbU (regulator of sigma subunit)